MSAEKRTYLIRAVLGLVVLAAAAWTLRDLPAHHLIGWIAALSMAVLVAAIHNLGLRASFGEITFVPVTTLMAYFTLGSQDGLGAVMVGLVAGTLVQMLLNLRIPAELRPAWWRIASTGLATIAMIGLALLAADWAYRAFGFEPPLARIDSYQAMAPVLAAPVIFLLVFNFLLILDLAVRGLPVFREFFANRRPILATQWLPLALAPFSAVAQSSLGPVALFIFEAILLTIAVAVAYLMSAQESLQEQVTRLHSFSAMNRALRTTLEKDALLETVFLQLANILKIRNMHIVLAGQGSDGSPWELALAVEDRHFVRRDTPYHMDSFAKWVLAERQPLLAFPVGATAEKLKIAHPPPAHTWMGVPLAAAGRVLGCIYTWIDRGGDSERVFTQEDLDILNTVAAQTGVALENADLYSSAQQQAAQLARLNQISGVMNASLNPEKVIELVADSVIEVAGCDKAAIYLLQTDHSETSLILAHAQGFSPEHIARSRDIAVPLSESERKQVIDEGKPVWVSDLSGEEVPPAALLVARREEFNAWAYLPLRAQLQPIGMLAVYYNQPHQFSPGEIELLETFANQAALAVTNARIYHRVDIQLAQRMEQTMRMHDINQRLSATLDMQTIFNLIIDTAMEGCHADAGVLVLRGDLEQGQPTSELNMVAWRGFDPARTTRMPHHVAEGIAVKVFSTGQTQITSLDDPTSSGPRSQLCVPIVLDDNVIGALALESERLNAFAETDMTFTNQLAVQAAVAIRNAQLYNHSQTVRDRLHAILDSSNDGLVMLDSKARIVMTNARMGDFWDFARTNFGAVDPEKFKQDPLSVLGEGLGYAEGELTNLLGRCIRNPHMKGETDLYEVRGGPGSHRQRFVERTATPVRDEQGSFIGLLLIFRDETQAKELEEAREDLTRLIVHDLRAPLQTVMGSMKLIEQVLPDARREVKQATNLSERAVQKLLNLVNDLLDISSLESGQVKIQTSIESVRTILEDTVQAVSTLTEEHHAIVKVEETEDPLYGEIDKDMIERVVLNLVDNALKHTKPGTVVTVRGETRPASDPAERDMLLVQVSDDGAGVPDDYKEKIFDRFTQVPGQTAARRSTGLGLAFCRLAIESHGGKIWVTDNPGGGSIFQFTLPAVRSDLPHDEDEDESAASAGAKPVPQVTSGESSDGPDDGQKADRAQSEPSTEK